MLPEKNQGLPVLLGVGREPRPRPIRGCVADLFYLKTRGLRRGEGGGVKAVSEASL